VKRGDAVLLLVPSWALKHAIRRDKWNETPASSLWRCCQLNGAKMHMAETCISTTFTALVSHLLAIFWIK